MLENSNNIKRNSENANTDSTKNAKKIQKMIQGTQNKYKYRVQEKLKKIQKTSSRISK